MSVNGISRVGLLLLLIAKSSVPASADEVSNNANSLFELGLNELLNVRLVTAASGFEQNIENAPASVTVIDAEEWQAMGATELFEALRHVPGLHITKMQTAVSNEKPVIRGLSGAFGQQILILIDGLPLRHIRDGGTLWGQRIPLNAFKRIEIIRSPGSAIYGADAMGGIINLVSYSPGEMPTRFTARAGNLDTQQVEWSHKIQWETAVLQAAFGAQTSEGDRSRWVDSDLQSLLDAERGTQTSHAPGPLSDRHTIYSARLQFQHRDLSVNYYNWFNRETGTGGGVAQALDPDGYFRQQAQTLSAEYDLSSYVSGEMNVTATWHSVNSRLRSTIFPAGSEVPIGSDGNVDFLNPVTYVAFPEGVLGFPGNDDQAISLQFNHIFEAGDAHHVRWSIGYEHVETDAFEVKNFGPGVLFPDEDSVVPDLINVTDTPYVYLPNKRRDNWYAAIQDQWALTDTVHTTIGVRYDRYSDFGSTWNPRVGVLWHVSPRLTAKWFLGTAFRAPSFVDLYSQNNPTAMGNSNLRPESIDTMDGGFALNYRASDTLQMEMNLFQYKADNIISYVPDAGVQVAQNVGRLEMHGLEYQLNWRPSRLLSVAFNYSHLEETDRQEVDIASVPKQMANLTAHWRLQDWHWFVGGKWVAKRERAPGDARANIDDYFWVDSRLHRNWQQWEFGLSLRNLADVDAREPSNGVIPSDYPLAGRHWLLDVTYAID